MEDHNIDEEGIKQLVRNVNSNLKRWTMIFFGLFILTIILWTNFFNPDLMDIGYIGNYTIFILMGISFIIGYLMYKIFKTKLKNVDKTHSHSYDNSLHCEICGKYWGLKTCRFCNSDNIQYERKTEDFEYFNRVYNRIKCISCGKLCEIDSFTSTKMKGVKHR